MKNFALIGASGYIAPRHMKAIKDTGNRLVCAMDINDSVGIIDSHFPEADFFIEFERFDRHVDKLRRKGTKIDYVAIATPNYLHDSHIRFGLRNNADVICEKPLVLNPWNIDALLEIEKETGKRVWNLFQLRLHPAIMELKAKVEKELKANPNKRYEIDLTYLTSRGHWYFTSWKGDIKKSGGVATNIGVHFFDMLSWIFGECLENVVHLKQDDTNAGYLKLKHADVKWFLSVNYDYIPEETKKAGKRTFRILNISGESVEFSDGFTELHTRVYEEILKGNGYGLSEAYNSTNIVSKIRKLDAIGKKGDYHPFISNVLK